MQGGFEWRKRQVDKKTTRYRSRASRVYFPEVWVVQPCEARARESGESGQGKMKAYLGGILKLK